MRFGETKVDDEMRKIMLEMRERGESYRNIASVVGVSHTTVMGILKDGNVRKMKERIARENNHISPYDHERALAKDAGYSSPWARYNGRNNGRGNDRINGNGLEDKD